MGLNQKQLFLLLAQKYECEQIGRCFPKPYCSEDDMPTIWETPSGFSFSVSNPTNGKYYPNDAIKLIIERAKLNVVHGIDGDTTSIDDLIDQFKSA